MLNRLIHAHCIKENGTKSCTMIGPVYQPPGSPPKI